MLKIEQKEKRRAVSVFKIENRTEREVSEQKEREASV